MTKNIDIEPFVYNILQPSKYAFVNQFEGIYKVRDDYIDSNYKADCYALVSMEDDRDVIVLDDYLNSPKCKITYDDSYGIPSFEIDAGGSNTIELSFVKFVHLN